MVGSILSRKTHFQYKVNVSRKKVSKSWRRAIQGRSSILHVHLPRLNESSKCIQLPTSPPITYTQQKSYAQTGLRANPVLARN